jgi:TadE-like protein
MRKPGQCGQSLIEFTFVGIPVMFTLICIFEISRGMWIYGTLNHAVKEGVRYAIVHGQNCGINGNSCLVNLGPAANKCNNTNSTIAEVIQCAGIGLDPANTQVRFTSALGPTPWYPLNTVPATQWPPPNGNLAGEAITIDLQTPFNTALAMFWPGSSPVRFGSGILPASSSDLIQY